MRRLSLSSSFFVCFASLILRFQHVSSFASVVQGEVKTNSKTLDQKVDSKKVLNTVAVTGATGRTGRLVVSELLDRGVPRVVAIVRNEKKASEVFPDPPPNLEIVQCDLTNENDIASALRDADAAIWCATGFSDGEAPLLVKLKGLLGLALAPKRSIDVSGVPAIANSMRAKNPSNSLESLPKVVMLSSAGVTRPTWNEKKKELFPGAADIPIVRLNPFGILDVKRESEAKLRASGVDYCIVRPAGLNDNWPAGSRPIFSQGDVAVGRINRKDVAEILVDVLTEPEAVGKTFEVISIAGYPKALSFSQTLSRLIPDKDGLPSLDSVAATYMAMQQILPGEKQDSAALAMGQTYEELDQGKTGRLGKRGEEKFETAAPRPSS
jgi:uncharacterized protein YbjT (DUF2867 family)